MLYVPEVVCLKGCGYLEIRVIVSSVLSLQPSLVFVSQWIKMQEVREDLSIDDNILTCIAFAEMDARTVHFSLMKIKMSLFAPER